MINVAFNLPSRENHLMRSEIDRAIGAVLDSGIYLLGNQTLGFEEEFADFCAADHCVTVGNGTDALEIALRALGVAAGDEVITVANAGGYTTTACRLIGAIPVYIDVARSCLLMDLGQIPHALSDKTRCVVATHLYGQTVDVPYLREVLNRAGYENVAILEDCAQAHGSRVANRPVGSLGNIATFSFYPTKNLGALGDGGAVVTSDPELMQRCKALKQYGWSSKYRSDTLYGRNSRMDELQAAILRVKLRHLSDLNRRRHAACEQLMRACPGCIEVVTRPTSGHVTHLFVVRHPRRDEIRDLLRKHGIASDIHYPVLDMEQQSMCNQPFRALEVPVSKAAAMEIFSLPYYAAIEPRELENMQEVLEFHVSRLLDE